MAQLTQIASGTAAREAAVVAGDTVGEGREAAKENHRGNMHGVGAEVQRHDPIRRSSGKFWGFWGVFWVV